MTRYFSGGEESEDPFLFPKNQETPLHLEVTDSVLQLSGGCPEAEGAICPETGECLLCSDWSIDKPEAKSQSKAQSPKKPQKGKEEFGLWASH